MNQYTSVYNCVNQRKGEKNPRKNQREEKEWEVRGERGFPGDDGSKPRAHCRFICVKGATRSRVTCVTPPPPPPPPLSVLSALSKPAQSGFFSCMCVCVSLSLSLSILPSSSSSFLPSFRWFPSSISLSSEGDFYLSVISLLIAVSIRTCLNENGHEKGLNDWDLLCVGAAGVVASTAYANRVAAAHQRRGTEVLQLGKSRIWIHLKRSFSALSLLVA